MRDGKIVMKTYSRNGEPSINSRANSEVESMDQLTN